MTRATLCACVPAALGAFDFGLLALAGPRIAPALGVTGAAYPWLFSASSFAYGAAVMPAAALTGRIGPQRALVLGLGVAAIGLGALALCSSLAATVAARVVFGLGGALGATAALALLAGIVDATARAAGFAGLGAAVAAGFATGALLAAADGWRPVLLGASVIALAAARLSAVAGGPVCAMPAAPAGVAATAGEPVGPMPGTTLLTAAIALIAAGLAASGGWAALSLLAAAAAAGAGVRRAASRLRPHGVDLARACLAGAATTATGVGATILIGPALTADRLPTALLGIFGLGVLPGGWLARRLAADAGPPFAASAGVACQALALLAVAAAFGAGAPPLLVAVALLGFGTAHVAANAGAAAAALAGGSAAPAAALLIASQYVGGGIGPLATTAVAAAHGMAPAVACAAVVAFAGAVPLAVAQRRPSSQRTSCRA